tara:strand:- start:63 stop:440 length:378 start_codon:yes stop_codon:yes gene_type:complete
MNGLIEKVYSILLNILQKPMNFFAYGVIILIVGSGCATKSFQSLHHLDAGELNAMSCEDIEQEFILLNRHEDEVDLKASSGQIKQIFLGGIWSVMADEKLEHIARKEIRDRERLLYEAKLKKDCS